MVLNLRRAFQSRFVFLVEQLATLVEGPDKYQPHPTEQDIYRLSIATLWARIAAVYGEKRLDTFRLLKLHGATNWFYSGEGGSAVGSQVYYEPVRNLKNPQTRHHNSK